MLNSISASQAAELLQHPPKIIVLRKMSDGVYAMPARLKAGRKKSVRHPR